MAVSFSWTLTAQQDAASLTPAQASSALLPKNLQLDDDGDLLIEGGNLVISRGATFIQQALLMRLKAIRGDWFLDPGAGIPYFDDILGTKAPSLVLIRSILEEAILDSPGILEILNFEMDLERSIRHLGVAFSASSDFGELAVSGEVVT